MRCWEVLAEDAGDKERGCFSGVCCGKYLYASSVSGDFSGFAWYMRPYTPAVSERLVLNAGDYGLAVQERAELIMLFGYCRICGSGYLWMSAGYQAGSAGRDFSD